MDIFKEMLWYSLDSDISSWVPLKLDQVNEIIEANDKGEIPDDLSEFAYEEAPKVKAEFEVADFVGGNAEESINRFDQPKKQSNKGNRNRNRNRNRANKPQKKRNNDGFKGKISSSGGCIFSSTDAGFLWD